MKVRRAIIFLFLFSFLIPSISFSRDGLKGTLTEVEMTGKKWKSFTPCQKLFILGYASYIGGRLEEAKERFKTCDGNYPVLQKQITEFLKKISAGGESFFYLDRGEEMAEEIRNLEARLLLSNISPEDRSTTAFELAKTYFKNRQYSVAIELFKELSEEPGLRLISLEYLATSLARAEKYEEAIVVNRQIIEEFPKDRSVKAKALYKIGFLYLDGGRYSEAEEALCQLQKTAPGYMRGQVEWYLAWCAYKQENFSSAVKLFSELERRGGKDWRKRASYWKGVSYQKMGEKGKAAEIFNGVYNNGKLSYYGMLSAKRLKIKDIKFPFTTGEDGFENGEGFASDGKKELLAAAYELDRLGLSELVVEELGGLIKVKKRELNWDDVNLLAVKNSGWYLIYPRVSYPKAYEKLVIDLAKKTGVDQDFIWAIMREESTFRPKAVSKSGAIGLMQLMPFTAKRMTSYHPFRIENVFLPKINIDAGARYLSFLLKRYKGNMYLTAAGYNAGEEAVDRWAAHGFPATQEETEEFVEEIPYKETNEYVKKVMKSYWVYEAGGD